MENRTYLVTEAEKLTGEKAHVLRYWEDELGICKKRYFSILHALDFVAEVEDFTFHYRLQAEVARGDQFI